MNLSNRGLFRRAALGLAAATLVLPGCYWPGGSGFSVDTHTYVSTSWDPCTITLKDTRTGQDIWSIDVPVDKQLVVHFDQGLGVEHSGTPDLMRWQIFDAGTLDGELSNSFPCPPGYARRLDYVRRAAPELPESMARKTGGTGAAATGGR